MKRIDADRASQVLVSLSAVHYKETQRSFQQRKSRFKKISEINLRNRLFREFHLQPRNKKSEDAKNRLSSLFLNDAF